MSDTLKPVGRDLLINSLVNGRALPRTVRGRIWNAIGHDVHRTASIAPDCLLTGRSGLTIGAHVLVNDGCLFDVSADIVIGDSSQLGYGVALVTSSHEIGGEEQRAGSQTFRPIEIGRGVWIGSRATVLQGVTVGDGCILAAGSVVTKDCEPNGLYAGVPAERRRDLPVRDGAVEA